MDTAILSKILAFKNATLEEMRARYMELYGGKEPPNISKVELWKKLAYKIQERPSSSIIVSEDSGRNPA